MTQRKLIPILLLPVLLFLAACGSNSGPIPPPAGGGQGLEIVINGLPEGTDANVHVLGEDSTVHLTGSAVLSDLAAGNYDVISHGIGEYAAFGGGTFTVSPGQRSRVELTYERIETVLAEDTHVVVGSAGFNLIEETDGVLTFEPGTPELEELEVGDIILTGVTPGTPGGFLGRVTRISGLNVYTEPAGLEDAFEQASFSLSHEFTIDDIDETVGVTSPLPGVTATAFQPQLGTMSGRDLTRFPFCVSLEFDLGASSGPSGAAIAVDGNLCLKMKADFSMSLHWRLPPVDGSFLVTGEVATDLTVTGLVSTGISARVPLAILPLSPIPLGPTGVTLVPKITVYLGASGTVSAELTTGVTYDIDYKFGASFENGDWNDTASFDHDLSFQWPTPTSTLSARVFAGPELSTTINGLVGPTFGINAFVQLDVTPFDDPLWELSSGLEVNVGIEVLLGLLTFNKTLVDVSWVIADSGTEPPEGTRVGVNTQAGSYYRPAVVSNDLVYVADTEGTVHALGAALRPLWTFDTGARNLLEPVVAGNGNILVSSNAGLFALSPEGNLLWQALPGLELAGPAGTGPDGSVVVGDNFGGLHSFSAAGTPQWSVELTDREWLISPVIAPDGLIYFGDGAGGLLALNPDGSAGWHLPEVGYYLQATVTLNDDLIYAAFAQEAGNRLFALDRHSGAEVWSLDIGSGDNVSQALLAPDGTLYLVVSNQGLVAVSAAGEYLWRDDPGGWTTTPAVTSDGRVFVATENKLLHAYSAEGDKLWDRNLRGISRSGVTAGQDGVVFMTTYTEDPGIEAVTTVSP